MQPEMKKKNPPKLNRKASIIVNLFWIFNS